MVKTVEDVRHFAVICRELYGIKLPKLRGQTTPDFALHVACHEAGSLQCSLPCVIQRAIPPTFHVKNQRYLSHLPQCITLIALDSIVTLSLFAKVSHGGSSSSLHVIS